MEPNHGNGCGAECTLVTPCNNPEKMICYEPVEAQKPEAVKSNSTGLLSGNRPGVDEYLPGNDSREDLFEFDEQGAMSFPCCSCTWKSEDQMKCVKCRHFAI